eukprot:7680895-Pyramimonas_sp.AAC.1
MCSVEGHRAPVRPPPFQPLLFFSLGLSVLRGCDGSRINSLKGAKVELDSIRIVLGSYSTSFSCRTGTL